MAGKLTDAAPETGQDEFSALHGIQVSGTAPHRTVSGGTVQIIQNWKPEEDALDAVATGTLFQQQWERKPQLRSACSFVRLFCAGY